jgi:WD40-like Beta Propeller Repeat
MPHGGRRRHRCGLATLTLVALLWMGAPVATASGPPEVVETWASSVFASSARLEARINPNGIFTTYHFDYISKAGYDSNVAASKDPFSGASRIPAGSDANVGSVSTPVPVLQFLSGLSPDTTYYYRAVASNSTMTNGPVRHLTTQSSGGGALLADSRGWEMVSPVDKNGGQAGAPETIADGGVMQAAADGGAITYGSEASFAGGGQGAPTASQYVAFRSANGWSANNVSPPLFSGSYDNQSSGAPYQLFSGDLTTALLLNGEHCRGEGSDCAVDNPPLAGTDAPTGYQDYYLRDNGAGTFTALLGAANSGFLNLAPAHFDLFLAGTSPDLTHGVLSTCAALTSTATQVALGEGCDPSEQNLYEYGSGAGLTLINSTPGAKLAAQSGAISEDGTRVYFTQEGDLYLRQGSQTFQVDESLGGGGEFQIASTNASVVFFTKAGHLYRYLAGGAATDLTPSGGVVGVLGASSTGDYVYYQDASALKLWHTTTTTVAPGTAAESSDYPPSTGTARVSPDGTRLLFVSRAGLTEFDNTDLSTGISDGEVYLYDSSGAGALTCVSCNPTNERPVGSASIPGAIANGSTERSLRVYKPRVLSENGKRAFFNSDDTLGLNDSDNDTDAYEWEAQGEGSCNRAGGCISLLSSGRSAGGASFVDASADGSDAFFLTEGSLVAGDLGALDLYDARVGGGFPVAVPPILCEGDACQSLPPEPVDPTLTTLQEGPGNPKVRFQNQGKRCKRGFVRRHGKCVRKRKKRHRRRRHPKRHHKRRSAR